MGTWFINYRSDSSVGRCCSNFESLRMATGIEIAGLALAIFPITVKGLRWMVDGVETIKYWRRYRRKLEDYACDLEAARVYYLDTLEELLMGIVISDDEMSILVEDPGGNAWNKPEYEQNLRRRLDRSYDPYLQILLRMQKALTELRDKLGFDEYGKVRNIVLCLCKALLVLF